ncbi:hypothetical protein J6590_049152 [Homalodisca vitripennis]|nr:hypothetical protein J6590_049152 [Homalodisca vitripennis]
MSTGNSDAWERERIFLKRANICTEDGRVVLQLAFDILVFDFYNDTVSLFHLVIRKRSPQISSVVSTELLDRGRFALIGEGKRGMGDVERNKVGLNPTIGLYTS